MAEKDKEKQQQTKSLQEIGNELKKQNKENDDPHDDIQRIREMMESDQKLEFQDEQRFEVQSRLIKEQNSLLKAILDKTKGGGDEEDKPKKKGFIAGLIGTVFSAIFMKWLNPKKLIKIASNLLFKIPFVKPIVGIFKKIFGGKLFKGLGGIAKKLVGGKLIRVVGKVFLRIFGFALTAVFALFDFAKGWKDAEAITGRTGWAAKFQGGFASMLSGLTFGLIDPKTISKWLDGIKDDFWKNLLAPLDLFFNVFDFAEGFQASNSESFMGKVKDGFVAWIQGTIDGIANFFSGQFDIIISTFSYLSDKISIVKEKMSGISFADIGDFFMDNFINPIWDFVKKIEEWRAKIMSKVQSMTFGLLDDSAGGVKSKIKSGWEAVKNIKITNPFASNKKDIEDKAVAVANKQTQPSSTNMNNVVTDNSKTTVNQPINMSTGIDDRSRRFRGA